MVLALAFNATFNSISVISWRSVLLVEEIRESRRPAAGHSQTLSDKVAFSTPHNFSSIPALSVV